MPDRADRKAMGHERILVLNPGSTSTKLAVFEGEESVFEDVIRHSELDLGRFARIWDQYEYRKGVILEFLHDRGISLHSFVAVVGRGGLFRPTVSGTYRVNDTMIADAREGTQGEHASNLGAVLAFGIAWDYGIDAFIVDPPCVDELDPVARYSGLPEIPRTSLVHALNVKATARAAAKELGKDHSETNLVIAHLGGGISICALRRGRMIDVSNALSAGPFTPERAGALPTAGLVKMCFSGERSEDEIARRLVGGGGFMAYLQTNSAKDVEDRIAAGDQEAARVMDAMVYQIAKEIGAMAAVLRGDVDAIILTGGLAKSDYITSRIESQVGFLGRVILVPGEDELEALALGCLRVLRGEEDAKVYPEPVEGAEPFTW
jgi:butyrate kinase